MCGVVQHSLKPVPYYRDVIRAAGFSKEMVNFRLAQLSNWIENNNLRERPILEVGSGKGEYLSVIKAAGSKISAGLEASFESVKFCKSLGLEVQQGYLDGFLKPLDGVKYSGFAIFSFMEHWPNINASLINLHEFLTDDAVGIIEVPNFEMILNKGLLSEFTVDHIFYFDKNSLKSLLERSGFDIVNINYIWNDYILSAEVKKKKSLNLDYFKNSQARITKQILNFIDNSNEKVIIWGAGHQSLAVIALAGIHDSIECIVDSATFKQEKYTPASHIKIKSPEYLLETPLKSLIVMGGGYSDEIADVVKSKYKNINNLAILREDKLEILIG